MAMSIGMEYRQEKLKTCLMENERVLESCSFNDAASALAYLKHTCAIYPEPIIAIASGLDTRLAPLHSQSSNPTAFNDLLRAIGSTDFHSYNLPSVWLLPGIPVHRKCLRLEMGTSDKLCAVTTLLYRMRRREASWQEMRFLYLDVNHTSWSILVVEDGCIVNGISEIAGNHAADRWELINQDTSLASTEKETIAEQAFWEGLTYDLAGLMAIHHLEDVVAIGPRKDTVIARLQDSYQFYHFPHSEYEQEGFEAAIGAALIAEGLYRPGLAAEVVERLQLPQTEKKKIKNIQHPAPPDAEYFLSSY